MSNECKKKVYEQKQNVIMLTQKDLRPYRSLKEINEEEKRLTQIIQIKREKRQKMLQKIEKIKKMKKILEIMGSSDEESDSQSDEETDEIIRLYERENLGSNEEEIIKKIMREIKIPVPNEKSEIKVNIDCQISVPTNKYHLLNEDFNVKLIFKNRKCEVTGEKICLETTSSVSTVVLEKLDPTEAKQSHGRSRVSEKLKKKRNWSYLLPKSRKRSDQPRTPQGRFARYRNQ
ncbi:PREDICTED: uncharacterized protein LOC108777001 isoform X2 [Cyphomyrmex costatus]|uniref:uncharacterized protein LOC108777001 isoform X2 n=1 Tax=Cyphomyrmex costatus TaxID=456900 RepID=UPI0008524454|nr:PREDICTED: uncharacterized protein LOC108777001 isoform X2 [Cyphomyrmex costatus]